MKQGIKRGNIFFVAKHPTQASIGSEIWSDRYGIIVSNDTMNETSGAVEVIYLSTSLKNISSPLHIAVTCRDKNAIALCEQIHTVDKSRIKQCVGHLSWADQKEIDKALAMSLAIEEVSYRGLFSKWEKYIKEYNIQVIEEIESIITSNENQVVLNLKEQLDIARAERDGYRAVAEAREIQIKKLNSMLDKVSKAAKEKGDSHATC